MRRVLFSALIAAGLLVALLNLPALAQGITNFDTIWLSGDLRVADDATVIDDLTLEIKHDSFSSLQPYMHAIGSFFFDPKTKACKPFQYSGCGANGNNFASEAQCRSLCPGEFFRGRLIKILNAIFSPIL